MAMTPLQELKEKVLKDPKAKAAYDNDTLEINNVEVIFHPEIKTKAESGQIKIELLELVSKNVESDSPEAIEWMEKAANSVWQDKLQPGQVWKHNPATGLEKVWVN